MTTKVRKSGEGGEDRGIERGVRERGRSGGWGGDEPESKDYMRLYNMRIFLIRIRKSIQQC